MFFGLAKLFSYATALSKHKDSLPYHHEAPLPNQSMQNRHMCLFYLNMLVEKETNHSFNLILI